MQNRAGFSHRTWLTFTALLASLGVSLWMALPSRPAAAQAVHSSGPPMVLQGQVIDVQKDSITIRTPNIRPRAEPGKMMPMYIIAGETFKADISHAVFESPMGLPNAQNDLKAGDAVIVVCDPINMALGSKTPWPVTASVVERVQVAAAP